jgi:hypothetical protein
MAHTTLHENNVLVAFFYNDVIYNSQHFSKPNTVEVIREKNKNIQNQKLSTPQFRPSPH